MAVLVAARLGAAPEQPIMLSETRTRHSAAVTIQTAHRMQRLFRERRKKRFRSRACELELRLHSSERFAVGIDTAIWNGIEMGIAFVNEERATGGDWGSADAASLAEAAQVLANHGCVEASQMMLRGAGALRAGHNIGPGAERGHGESGGGGGGGGVSPKQGTEADTATKVVDSARMLDEGSEGRGGGSIGDFAGETGTKSTEDKPKKQVVKMSGGGGRERAERNDNGGKLSRKERRKEKQRLNKKKG